MSEKRNFRFPRPRPYDPNESLALLSLGPHDPTFRRIDQRGWWTLRWIEGTLCRLVLACGQDSLVLQVEGPAAGRVGEEHARALFGLDDRPGWQLDPGDPLSPLLRAKPGLRLVRAFWLYEGGCQVVLAQRVSWREAVGNWSLLCRRYGERWEGLFSAPSPERLFRLGMAELASCGIEAKRALALKEIARRLAFHPEPDWKTEEIEQRLSGCPRIGPWTRSLIRGQVLGERDVVPLGDYGLPGLVCSVLAGERPGSDARMLELLEPYQGERFRAIRYLWSEAAPNLRRGPRLPLGQGIGRLNLP